MRPFEIWVTDSKILGADPLYCGDVPKVGTLLNGRTVRLVGPHPYNSKQFLVFLTP